MNIFGGFVVTQRMLSMFKTTAIEAAPMSASLTSLAYLVAAVLFILALRGLSSPGHVAPGQPLRHDRHGRGGGRHAGCITAWAAAATG